MNYELVRFMKETAVYCFKAMRHYLIRKTLGPISELESCSPITQWRGISTIEIWSYSRLTGSAEIV